MDIQLLIVLAVLGLATAYLVRRYWRSIKRGKCNCDCDCNASKCRCHGGIFCETPPGSQDQRFGNREHRL